MKYENSLFLIISGYHNNYRYVLPLKEIPLYGNSIIRKKFQCKPDSVVENIYCIEVIYYDHGIQIIFVHVGL